MTALGLGTDALHFRAKDGRDFRLTVTVTEPLFED